MIRWVWLFAFLASSCAHSQNSVGEGLAPGVYDTRDFSRAISMDELYERLGDFEFVLIGESHDSVKDHALQADIYRALTRERAVALGMEMFQRPFQPALDAYISGEIDEQTMLVASEYESRWGFDPGFYRPLWERAQETQSPMIALNVRRELTKRVAAVGVEGLSEAERRDIPEMDLSSEAYRMWLGEVFRAHGMSTEDSRFDRFFQAQILWDETMAESATRFIEQNQLVTTVVVIAGRGHIENRWGISDRIARRMPNAKIATVLRVQHATRGEAAIKGDFILIQE